MRDSAEENATLPAAMSRWVGIWLGVVTLTATYLAGVMSGVRAPTALIRGAVVGVCLMLIGRALGFFIGQSLERSLRTQSEETP